MSSELHLGIRKEILELKEGAVSSRLLELGFLPGRSIELVRMSPLGDSVYVKVGQMTYALRIEELDFIVTA